ncbi:alpha/beta hydrolase [Altericista sp. CCNU0014]|uniref:alpha/beta hydrolase n=1 Tax=Altericista sp. CCNU0014 TaxID=3082949 RepID=UPI00384F0505
MLENKPFLLPGSSTHACLLLHGLGGGAYEMQWLGQHLNTLGLTVQSVLYPGHDRPAKKMPRSCWQDWYAHILENYLTLSQNYERVSLVGFSTGCLLGLNLAMHYPTFKLVMMAPYLGLKYEWYYGLPLETYINTLGYLIRDVPRLRLPISDPAIEKLARKAVFFSTFNLDAVRSAIELMGQVQPKLSTLHNPLLIVQSRKDTVVDPNSASLLYQQIGSTDKQILWLKDSDHIIPLDRERNEVFRAVGEFLVR